MLSSNDSPHQVLFVCRHNAVRSQIAEALLRCISHGNVEVFSAGVGPAPVPAYIQDWVGRLYGNDVNLKSSSLDTMASLQFDTIITLCDKSHITIAEHPEDHRHVRWNFPHPDDPESLQHLEIELSDRIRLFLQANRLL